LSRVGARNVAKYVDQLSLPMRPKMADLYALEFSDIADYLAELGDKFSLKRYQYI